MKTKTFAKLCRMTSPGIAGHVRRVNNNVRKSNDERNNNRISKIILLDGLK